MQNKCSTESQTCQETAEECCPTQSEDCCPIEQATNLWKSAFFQAMKEVHVDILKAKIQKAWGPKLEKSADAVLEAMETQWKSSLTKGKAQHDLKEKLKNIMTEGK